MSPLPNFRRQQALSLALLFLAVFSLYAHGLSPAWHPDDSAETITAGATLGLQHPPGYPLHSLLGRLAVLLGPGPAPFNVNLLAAFCGALAVALAAGVLAALGSELAPPGTRPWAVQGLALAGALALAATQTLWFQAGIAKGGVYTLNLALTFFTLAALLALRRRGLAGPAEALRGDGAGMGPLAAPLALAGLGFGLGMADHWTSQVVLVPGLAWLTVEPWARRRTLPSPQGLLRLLGPALLAVAAGFALYLYLPLRSRQGLLLSWGQPDTWAGFWWIFNRSQYAGIEAGKTWAAWWALMGRMGQDLLQDWTGPGLLALAGGWGLLAWRRWWLALGLLALPLLLGLAVATKANPPADSLFIIDPYLVPLHVGLGLGLIGYAALLDQAPWLGLVLLAGALGLAAHQWPFAEHHDDYLGYDYTHDLLLGAPKGSLLFCEGDSNTAGPFVPRFVQGQRRDLTLLASVLLDYPWYRACLAVQDPGLRLPAQALGPAYDMKAIVQANPGRPALWTNSGTQAWLDSSHLVPRGLLFQLDPAHAKPWTPALLRAHDIFKAYALRGVFAPEARVMDPISTRLVRDNDVAAQAVLAGAWVDLKQWAAARALYQRLGVERPGWGPPWVQAGNADYLAGDKAAAMTDWQRAVREDPSSAEGWADLGLVELEQGHDDEAAGMARKALALRPDLVNAQQLLQQALARGVGQPLAHAALKVRAVDRGAGQAVALRGDQLGQAGRYAQALAAYDQAVTLGFNNAILQRNRGVMLSQLGRQAEGAQALAEALKLGPESADLRKLHGYILFNAGQHDAGLAELRRAAQLAPGDPEIQRLLTQAGGGKP
jgi:tetratricopeptide (TPR) repeat protein